VSPSPPVISGKVKRQKKKILLLDFEKEDFVYCDRFSLSLTILPTK
jgi:hypothetical protein